MKKRNYLIYMALPAVFGCQSKPVADGGRISCSNSDWFEIGRRDGAAGAPLERQQGYSESCGQNFDDVNENAYRNGRERGLVEYCTETNAFELGRMRVNYYNVCPSALEEKFQAAYSKGEYARTIEMENQRISKRIDQLNQQLDPRRSIASDEMAEVRK